MKKKNASVNSVEIIYNVIDGKLKKEKVDVKVGSVFPLPFDREIFTARASVLNNQGSLKAIEHMTSIMEEDKVGKLSLSAINTLGSVVDCKLRLDNLQLYKRIYEMIPEIDGMTIGFDKSITGFKILKNEDEDMNTLTEVLTTIKRLEDSMKPKDMERAKKLADNMENLSGLDVPVSKKMELADNIAKAQVVIDKIDKAEAEGVEPEVTEKELQSVKDSTESVKEILGLLKTEGGIA